MIIKEYGDKHLPTIILIHGGGLSNWSLQPLITELENDYHLVTPILEGHGEAANETFMSIHDSALTLIDFINTKCNSKVFAIAGLSIGAQIVTEILSLQETIATYAIIESALVIPLKGITNSTIPLYNLFFGLIKYRWFSRLQAKTLSIPENMFETYYTESRTMTKQTLINMTLSNGNYILKDSIKNTKSKVLIICGEKEIGIMKKSAKKLHSIIPQSRLFIASGMKHGELSIKFPQDYMEQFRSLISSIS